MDSFRMRLKTPDRFSGWLRQWNQLSRQIRRQLGERYALAGLTESRAAVLESLMRMKGQPTQSDLAGELNLSESNLCSLIERMRREGLLVRERSPLDRRKTVLSLTSTGREKCAEIKEILSEFEQALLSRASESLQSSLRNSLEELDCSLQAFVDSSVTKKEAA